jgi:Ca2+/H+ antiporter
MSPQANRRSRKLSLSVSVVLLLLHAVHLIYVLVTHRSVFTSGQDPGGSGAC